MERKNDFNKTLIMTVDEVLKDTFGEPGLLIYTYLKSQSVKQEEIPEKLDAFANCLENFSSGGSVVENMILRKLYSSFELEFKQTNENRSFTDHIAELRNSINH